jgi:hypothetical protein
VIEVLKADKELWELFTKKEEYGPQLLLDQYQRFPYYLSKHRNVLEPEVSDFLIQNKLQVNYPNGKKFAVCLTHDIDLICLPIINAAYKAAQALRKLQISKSLKMLLGTVKKSFSPVWNFAPTMELEAKYGAKSSFYFLALDKDDLDFHFKIEYLKDTLRRITNSGWEVGLHGGHKAYNDLNQLKIEKERLENAIGKEVVGYRNHFLRFKVPTTWELLKEAGFK